MKDKVIRYDPPGAIGLVDVSPLLLLRFNEASSFTLPQDEGPVCNDFGTRNGALTMPEIVDGVLGSARQFAGVGVGLYSTDIAPGATLATRDVSIQVVLSWKASDQVITAGNIIVRGLSGSASERVCYGLRIDTVDVPTNKGKIRIWWETSGGARKVQDGPIVEFPVDDFTMITATRRWVSSTEVSIRYYVGDVRVFEATSPDGDIGGGTTGGITLGYRDNGGAATEWLVAPVDELLVVARELCAEEVEATWLRLTRYQPLGVRLFREQFDEDFPISSDLDSDVQRDIAMTGQALGFAAAQAENLRANFLPCRAYGTTLEQWEKAVHVTPKPAAGIDERRARVEARIRQKNGISIPGIKDALIDLVDCDVDDLEFIAYDNTITDSFDTQVDPIAWDMTPTGCATWSAGKARISPGAGNFLMNGAVKDWKTMTRNVSQSTLPGVIGQEHAIVKLAMSTVADNSEAGLFVSDRSIGAYLLLGLRRDAGVSKVVGEMFFGGTFFNTLEVLGGNPAAIWLHLRSNDFLNDWSLLWSTTGESTGLSESTASFTSRIYHAGIYHRTFASSTGAVADFDDFKLRTPHGTRPFNAYVLRDPGLGGNPDLDGARSVIRAIKHGYTHATVVTSRGFLIGETGINEGPIGTP